jgi:ubiquinone/menaquinone biosynthesis C-methylase UbiE
MSNNAACWDNGCQTDKVRNEFIIPVVIDLFNAIRPQSILDVGAGTGFTARQIDRKLDYRPNWCLLDRDPERLDFATGKCPPRMNLETRCENFLSAKLACLSFDALFFGFTLLELGTGEDVLSSIDRLCGAKGTVIIAQPDVMLDVLAKGEHDPSLLKKFATEPVSLHKTDKFTLAEYPFHAERFESITYKVMRLGFSLERFEREVFDGGAVFLLAFVRRD